MTEQELKARKDFAIQQNITTLRNRVNELGVAEPVVQRQGEARIVVQLPGVQDTARAKEILGATATVEFRLVDENNDPYEAERRGRAPLGSELYFFRDNSQPILLKREIIVTGDQLTDATAGIAQDEGTPAVFVRLDAKGARKMLQTTQENLNKRMAVVFVENKTETVERDGEEFKRKIVEKKVINAATIRGVFSKSFQISGLESTESRNLALLAACRRACGARRYRGGAHGRAEPRSGQYRSGFSRNRYRVSAGRDFHGHLLPGLRTGC